MANPTNICNVKCESYAGSIIPKIYDHLVRGTTTCDCILGAEGKFVRAHKLILSISSGYFENMFAVGNVDKPTIIITGVNFADLCLILDFAYTGQASMPQDRLEDFIKAGELLQIRGLKDGRNQLLPKHVQNYTQQQPNRHPAVTSTQQVAPSAKRPREEDVSIQEATEIMKMLLNNSGEMEAEQSKAPIKQQIVNGASGSSQNPMRTQIAPQPQQNFYCSQSSQLKQEPKAPAFKTCYICRFCDKSMSMAGRFKKHEEECSENPDRIVAACEVCNSIMKPSALASHKKQKHGVKTKQKPKKVPTSEISQSASMVPGAPMATCTGTQLNAIDTTRPSPEYTQGRCSSSDTESSNKQLPTAVPDNKEEDEEPYIDVTSH